MSEKCPKCGTGLKFLGGEGPYCPSCWWRADDKPRPDENRSVDTDSDHS